MKTKQSKKTHQSIQRFSYYTTHAYPELFKCTFEDLIPKRNDEFILKSVSTQRNTTHYYYAAMADGVVCPKQLSIIDSFMQAYLNNLNPKKIDSNTFQLTHTVAHSWLPIATNFEDIIHFVIQANQKNYELYIFHSSQWAHFTQKYTFICENNATIKYQLTYSFQNHNGFFDTTDNLFHNFIKYHIDHNYLSKVQGRLLQSQFWTQKTNAQDACNAPTHIRKNYLPSQHYKYFTYVYNQVQKQWKQLHRKEQQRQHFLQNLVCRYLQAKEFKLSQALLGLSQYLIWQKDISTKYNLKFFQQIHKLDIYTCLGQDYSGRLVILNKAANVNIPKLQTISIDLYNIYFIYYLQIYAQKRMRGKADQVLIVADLNNLSSDNFKLSVTKKNTSDSLKISPQRQFKIIAINTGFFAYACWKLLKPLLPVKTHSKIVVSSTDPKEILQVLQNQMPSSVIPQYLGGTNTNTSLKQLQQYQSLQ